MAPGVFELQPQTAPARKSWHLTRHEIPGLARTTTHTDRVPNDSGPRSLHPSRRQIPIDNHCEQIPGDETSAVLAIKVLRGLRPDNFTLG